MELLEQELTGNPEEFDSENIILKPYIDDEGELSMETVCGVDERIKQIDTTTMPFKAICKLLLRTASGKNMTGTGFLTHRNKLYTAGHCVYSHDEGGWMRSITVIPGKSGPTEPYGRYNAAKIYATQEWVNNGSTRYDMGAIKLSSNINHSDLIEVTTTDANAATVCGYPGDRDYAAFQYRMLREIHKQGGRFLYHIDTYGGQSGSPLLKNSNTAIGIHNYGGCPNKSSDLTQSFINKIEEW